MVIRRSHSYDSLSPSCKAGSQREAVNEIDWNKVNTNHKIFKYDELFFPSSRVPSESHGCPPVRQIIHELPNSPKREQ